MPQPPSRIQDIEVLRGIAITMVLFAHLVFLLFWWPKSLVLLWEYITLWGGVDLFFALSGFVIARDLLPRLDQAAPAGRGRVLGAFLIRRAFRILPNAILWLFIAIAASAFLNKSGAFGRLDANLLDARSILTVTANYHMWLCNEQREVCGINGVYWSLSLEEQFYILLPLLYLATRPRFAMVIGCLAVGQIVIARAPWSFLWAIRTDALLLGVLLAVWSRHPTYELLRPAFLRNRWASVAGLLLMLVVISVVPEYLPLKKTGVIPQSTGLLAIACAVWVFVASFNAGYVIPHGMVKQALVWLGSRSYALYLTHIPVFAAIRELWFRLEPEGTRFDDSYAVRFLATALPLLFVATELSYRLVEEPMRRLGKRLAGRVSPG